MDFVEEQTLEIEALEAIYMDDFTAKDSEHLEILLRPHPDGGDENHVAVLLMVSYTPTYPMELPQIDIRIEKGLDESQRLELLSLSRSVAEENLGMAMVFTFAEAIKEWLVQNNSRTLTQHEQVIERKKLRDQKASGSDSTCLSASNGHHGDQEPAVRAAEYSSEAITGGTLVTRENFAEWKLKFDAEQAERWAAEERAEVDPEKVHRLTGKQFFAANSSAAFLAAIEAEEMKAGDIVITSDLYDDDDLDDEDTAADDDVDTA